MEPLKIIQLGFVATTIVFYTLFFILLWHGLAASNITPSRRKGVFIGCLIAIISWTILISFLAGAGFFSDFSSIPPRLTIVVIIPLVSIIWAVRTKTAKEIMKNTSVDRVIYLQSFRIFVEILLWMLFVQDLLPIQLTLEGRNFDIISGATAPVIALLLARNKVPWFVGLIWNIACLGLLVNIVTMAILSMPTPFRVFLNDPANTIVATFPIVWLPGLLVPLAYGLHFYSLRQLLIHRDASK